jgi:two-component system cell cycle response regulator CtrA
MKIIFAGGETFALDDDVTKFSEGGSHHIQIVPDAHEVIKLAREGDSSLIVACPDMKGSDLYDFIKAIRSQDIDNPILALIRTDDPEEKAKMLWAGADDVQPESISVEELFCRIKAIENRKSLRFRGPVCTVGNIVINFKQKTVEVKGQEVCLTGKEHQILEYLALKKGMTVTKDTLMDHLYPSTEQPGMRILDVFVCKLRKKLADANDGVHHIRTIWGKGFELTDEPVRLSRPKIAMKKEASSNQISHRERRDKPKMVVK